MPYGKGRAFYNWSHGGWRQNSWSWAGELLWVPHQNKSPIYSWKVWLDNLVSESERAKLLRQAILDVTEIGFVNIQPLNDFFE
jgi:hypothetical protein